MRILIHGIVVAALLSGCASVKVERSESITLADALKEVVTALNEMSNLPVDAKHGLVPAEVTVVFSITSGTKEGKSASIEIVPTGIVKEITGLSLGWISEVSEARGNTMTIKFRNILFATDKELVGAKTPEEITKIYEKLRDLGWNIKMLPVR